VGLASIGVTGTGIARLAFSNPIVTPYIDAPYPPAASTLIKIGTDLPVSGQDTMLGKPIENGAHLAIDEANANHTIPGYTLVFDPKDDVGPSGFHDPATGKQNVTDLISDALAAGIVGPFNSSVAMAVMPVENQAPIAVISPSTTNPCLTDGGHDTGCIGANTLLPALRPTGKVTYFRLSTPDNYQGKAMALYLFKKLGYRRVYVIDDTELYGARLARAFIAAWQKLGGLVIDHKSLPPTITSYVFTLTQIAATSPDVIYFGGIDSTGGTLLRQQMLQVPTLQNTPLAGGDGILTNSFAKATGFTDGPVFASASAPHTNTSFSARSFIAQYQATYGANSYGPYSATGYDCANILIQAIKIAIADGVHPPGDSSDIAQAKVFRQAVINAIQGISYDGITGHHSFDANGDTTDRVVSIYRLADEKGTGGWRFLTQVMEG